MHFLDHGTSKTDDDHGNVVLHQNPCTQIGGGQYAYGAAIALILIVIAVIAALGMWRLTKMDRLLQRPR